MGTVELNLLHSHFPVWRGFLERLLSALPSLKQTSSREERDRERERRGDGKRCDTSGHWYKDFMCDWAKSSIEGGHFIPW